MTLAGRLRRIPAAAALYVLAVALFLAALPQYYGRVTGFTTLICFGEAFEAKALPVLATVPHIIHYNSPGYDGQFYAQMALEPLLRDHAIYTALDTPPYRARRILFSWTAYLLGLGQPRWIVKAYAMQNIIAWLLLAALLLRWFPPSRARNVVPWLGCLFGVGMAASFRFALLEGPAMVIVVLAVMAVERNRTWLAAALLGLGMLARETIALASGALVRAVPGTWREVIRLGLTLAAVAVPFLLWTAYVRSLYPAFSYSNPDSFTLPFAGYAAKWAEIVRDLRADGWQSLARYNVGLMIGFTVQAGYLVLRRDWASPWWRVGAAYCLLMPFLSFPVWVGYPGAAPRVLLPLAFAFNAQVVKDRWFWPLAILGNLSVWHGVAMIGVPGLATLL